MHANPNSVYLILILVKPYKIRHHQTPRAQRGAQAFAHASSTVAKKWKTPLASNLELTLALGPCQRCPGSLAIV